ncbi:MAG: MBL fold metallo-hydrolase [Candidatus Heimdallarchaeota archaeon]|nr:MBL fold metallo-hydrolase [Candidatus Heimdallarchaeota archaeon]
MLDIDKDTISHIFLTHNDMDHVGALSLFPKAEIYLGEESKIKDTYRYKFLKDNEIIEVGTIKVQVINAPGHRVGHVNYLISDKFLFTGDAIILREGKVQPFYKLISSNFDNQLKSIRKIAKLKNIEGLFTAHGGYTTEFDEAIKEWK